MNRRTFNQTIMGAAALGFAGLPFREASAQAAKSVSFKFSMMIGILGSEVPLFEDRLALAQAAGYTGIEFVGEWQKWTDADYARVTPEIHGHGLMVDSMAGTSVGFSLPGGTEGMEQKMATAIACADKLGCPQLLLTSGKRMPGSSTQVCVDNLKKIMELAEKGNKEVVIEPIDLLENPTMYLTSVSEGFEICRAVGSPKLKVLYDVYHEQRQAGNLLEKFDKNIDYVGLVHIADVPGRHEPGTGEIRYDQIFRLLNRKNYKGFVAMEFKATGDPLTTLRNARLQAIAAANS